MAASKPSRPLATRAAAAGVGTKRHSVAHPGAVALPAVPTPDAAAARKLVLDLLSIPGVSGDEKAIAERIEHHLRSAGCPTSAIHFDKAHTKTPVKGNVGNLIVTFPGTLPGPRRLFMAHMDTVPVCVGAKPVVVDVRSAAEYGGGHVAGSVNLPLTHLEERLAEIPAGRPVVVHCEGGYRSAIAASLLQHLGRSETRDLVGGFKAWLAAKLPTSTSPISGSPSA
jgi:rhodanese-related sulfurtransferase